MSADVAAIVAGLTKAQKEALLKNRWNVSGYVVPLIEAGIVERVPSQHQPLLNLGLTPLGLFVRASLQQGESHPNKENAR